ncbi:unnamed protein product [Chrysodeixis includens]|uniref:NADH-ubiquinone oxidoreductase 75 kDa subunit, mitochondrial n=1 Tax=Chrysodeixis includens TaxID=689277 RepID=A0A9N8PZR0_CHRIL|nr:unnamed protein product [Chrysodeixis includens]
MRYYFGTWLGNKYHRRRKVFRSEQSLVQFKSLWCGMGCMASSNKIVGPTITPNSDAQKKSSNLKKNETVLVALSRLDEEIERSERTHPTARLAVVTAELGSIEQEIKSFEEITTTAANKDTYAKTIHQLFIGLDLYRRPMLASENEDFVANVNRKEMRRLELNWLKTRYSELVRERRVLHAQILRTRSLYAQLQHLLETIWGNSTRPGSPQEGALTKAIGLRDALAAVSARLRAAAEYAHAAVRLVDDAMPAWKLTSVGKSGWERTAACADACSLLVGARCAERGARRVLAAPAAPRAARSLRLALDYAFTDAVHDHKCQRATEIFFQFKEALVLLIDSIHQTTQIRQKIKTVPIFINGTPVTVPSYYTAAQALRQAKVMLPFFCFHDRLSIAGNCRMCLIEVEGAWKPQVACALNVYKNLKIRTNSEKVKKAQESVLEFILVDHPLDCPICDQGGECDLQDITVRFGNDRSRFTDIHFEGKRAVEDKTLNPLIRAEMNRCIHCTRCIRFGAQICGVEVIGSTGRGHDMLVGTYVDKMFLSELSGNVVDLCPVGALTNIPYKFKARSWELKKANSIDVTDATGTNIILNYRFDRVLRVLPREHDEINQEWVSDKGRWAIDSLEMQRLVTPMKKAGSCCCPLEWEIALKEASAIIKAVPPENVMAIAGPHTNVETLVTCKDFMNMLGSENTYVERGLKYTGSSADLRAAYSMSINMKDICNADKILLVGTNPRFEAPILNVWIRQAYKMNEADIYVIGPKCEYNYHVTYLGDSPTALPKANEPMMAAKNPLIFVGISQLETESGAKLMNSVFKLAASLKFAPKGWGIVNIVTREASFAGALEAGWKPGALEVLKKTPPKVVISLGADDVFYDWNPPQSCKVIYIGFQGDRGAEFAHLILPGSAYTEAGGLYLNMECRSQFALPAVLLNNLENLTAAEKDVSSCRKELRAARVNSIVQKGLAELKYVPRALTSLNGTMK